jgi:hypothetical protein
MHVIDGVILPDLLATFNREYLSKSDGSALQGNTENGGTASDMLVSVCLLAGAVAVMLQTALKG